MQSIHPPSISPVKEVSTSCSAASLAEAHPYHILLSPPPQRTCPSSAVATAPQPLLFILTWMLQQYAKDSGKLPSNSSTTLHPSPPHQPHRSHASTHCQSPSLFSSLTSVHYPSPPPFFPTIKNFKSWGSHLSSCGTTHSVVSMGPSISLAPFTPFPLFKQ